MVQAVASAQAGGISDDALGQAWAEAEELREAQQRPFAGSGCAMGLSLSQIVTLCAIMLPLGVVPRRALGGRWVQAAAPPAGRLLVVLALACQARVRVRWLDEIVLHRAPVLRAIEPHSIAWMAGQRGPDRSGERWREVRTHGPCLEHVIAAGGQGLERGGKLAQAARGMQGEAAETIARQAMPMGLDVVHPQRALERVLPRQWKQAERQLATARQLAAKVARYKRHGASAG